MNRLRLAVVLGCAALAAAATPAAAAPHVSTTAKTPAIIRPAHFSPDTPGVDVYLTSFDGKQILWQSNVGYADVGKYRRVAAGVYAVAMRPHGAKASTAPALRWTLNAKPGLAYTVAAVGSNAKLTGVVLQDSLKAPAKGHGLVRVIQAASRAPEAKLVADRVVLASSARFPSVSGYSAVPAGTWAISAQSGALSTSRAVSIKAGTVASVLVLDAKGSGITLRTLQDAAGTAAAPQGSIDTGAGGTAPRPEGNDAALWIAGALGLTALGALGYRRRPRSASAA